MVIVNGHFAAARLLVGSLQFEDLSKTKTNVVLKKQINVMDSDHVAQVSSIRDRAMLVQLLQKQSVVYYELSLLIRAVEALDHWRQTEHEFTTYVQEVQRNLRSRLTAFTGKCPVLHLYR